MKRESKHKNGDEFSGGIAEWDIDHGCANKDSKYKYTGEFREPEVHEWFVSSKGVAIKNDPGPCGMTQAGEFEILRLVKDKFS